MQKNLTDTWDPNDNEMLGTENHEDLWTNETSEREVLRS